MTGAESEFSLRPVRSEDAAALLKIYAPYVEQTVISFETAIPSLADFGSRIVKITDRLPWLVAETPAGIAGYAYATPHSERAAYQWSVDVSVYLAQNCRGKGIGRKLYQTLLPILTELGYFNAYAGIALPNPASVGLHQALGFEPVGVYRQVGYKFGAWHDVGWWQLALQPHQPEPDPPRRWQP